MHRLVDRCCLVLAFFLPVACQTQAAEDMDAAMRAEVGCLIRMARALDDRISDATSVAYGMMGRCQPEIGQAFALAARGMSAVDREAFRSRANQELLKSATAIVLEARSGRK